jgi:hypothetical protein
MRISEQTAGRSRLDQNAALLDSNLKQPDGCCPPGARAKNEAWGVLIHEGRLCCSLLPFSASSLHYSAPLDPPPDLEWLPQTGVWPHFLLPCRLRLQVIMTLLPVSNEGLVPVDTPLIRSA